MPTSIISMRSGKNFKPCMFARPRMLSKIMSPNTIAMCIYAIVFSVTAQFFSFATENPSSIVNRYGNIKKVLKIKLNGYFKIMIPRSDKPDANTVMLESHLKNLNLSKRLKKHRQYKIGTA